MVLAKYSPVASSTNGSEFLFVYIILLNNCFYGLQSMINGIVDIDIVHVSAGTAYCELPLSGSSS